MKKYKISWYIVLEENYFIHGRSLVTGNDEEQLYWDTIYKVAKQYHIREEFVQVEKIEEWD